MWKNIENMDETLMNHQRVINVCDVRCRIDGIIDVIYDNINESSMLSMSSLLRYRNNPLEGHKSDE